MSYVSLIWDKTADNEMLFLEFSGFFFSKNSVYYSKYGGIKCNECKILVLERIVLHQIHVKEILQKVE
jgi:hypothetical protein